MGFTQKHVLKTHIKIVHEGKEIKKRAPVQCEICENSFNSKYTLIRHISRVHEEIKTYVQCDICEMKFARKSSLTQHISTVHEGNKPFQCEICDTKFSRKSSLKNHILSIHEK